MKASNKLMGILKGLIEPLDTAERRLAYSQGDFPASDRVNDLAKRYRFDLYYDAARSNPAVFDMTSAEGLDSDHLGTLLKRLIPSVPERLY